MTDQVEDAARKTAEEAGEAKEAADKTADKATDTVSDGMMGTLRQQVVGSFTDAAKTILAPAIQQMSQQAAQQAAEYVKDEGPRLVKEQVLPKVMEGDRR